MGNIQAGVSSRLRGAVRDGTIWPTMLRNTPDIQAVNFQVDHVEQNMYEEGTTFELEVIQKIPSNLCLIFLFPSLEESDPKRIFYSDQAGSLDALNKIISERIGKNPETTQMAVCWYDTIFKISGLKGRVYLYWTQNVSVYTVNQIEIVKMQQTPFLVNTNKHHKILSVYPLAPQDLEKPPILFIHRDSVTWSYSIKKFVLFPLDTRRQAIKKNNVVYMTENELKVRRERMVIPAEERVYTDAENTGVNDDDISEFFSSLGNTEDIEMNSHLSGEAGQARLCATTEWSEEIPSPHRSTYNSESDSPSSAERRYAQPDRLRTHRDSVPAFRVPRQAHRTSTRRLMLIPRSESSADCEYINDVSSSATSAASSDYEDDESPGRYIPLSVQNPPPRPDNVTLLHLDTIHSHSKVCTDNDNNNNNNNTDNDNNVEDKHSDDDDKDT